ncbi:MAG: ABC transporter substrate-binding protein [Alphaproteobacteria bacterium]
MSKKLAMMTAVGLGALLAGTAYAEVGVTDTEIKIGDVNILTGPASFIGQAVTIGSKVAAAEINEAGGINGRKIVMVTEDDGYVPARSFQAAKKLIEVDKVFAINGTSGTANIMAMMPLIEENKVPVIVTTAPNKLVYEPKVRPTVFTIGADYADAFYAQLKFIHEKRSPKDAKYALVRQDDDFGVSVEEGYDRAVKEFKLNDVARIKYKRGERDFGAVALKLQSLGVNVLANGAIIAGSANLLSEARKQGVKMEVASVWSEILPVSVKLSKPSEYKYIAADYVAALADASVAPFMTKANKYLTKDEIAGINRYTLITYVGLHVLADAMKRCGKALTRECTVSELKKTKNFATNGMTAPISFDNAKHLSGTAVKIYEVDYGTMGFKALTDFAQY